MLRYPQKEIDEFNIQWENRKKQKKLPSFFTKFTRGEKSVEKHEKGHGKESASLKKGQGSMVSPNKK